MGAGDRHRTKSTISLCMLPRACIILWSAFWFSVITRRKKSISSMILLLSLLLA